MLDGVACMAACVVHACLCMRLACQSAFAAKEAQEKHGGDAEVSRPPALVFTRAC